MAKVYIQQQYPHVTADLVRVQRELQELMVASSDPLTERRLRHRREALERRRAELLDTFGRLGLGWLMLGGSVELVNTQSTPASSEPAPSPEPAPNEPAPADPGVRDEEGR